MTVDKSPRAHREVHEPCPLTSVPGAARAGADRGGAAVELRSGTTNLAGMRAVVTAYIEDACPWADQGAVLLVLTELVTNATRHATGWWRLSLEARAGLLVADVEDGSTRPPRPRAPDRTAGTGGLGWHIAERLTSGLEVHPHHQGKTVRATWTAAR